MVWGHEWPYILTLISVGVGEGFMELCGVGCFGVKIILWPFVNVIDVNVTFTCNLVSNVVK